MGIQDLIEQNQDLINAKALLDSFNEGLPVLFQQAFNLLNMIEQAKANPFYANATPDEQALLNMWEVKLNSLVN